MSRREIQKGVVGVLQQSGSPMTIQEIVDQLRLRPEFDQVTDFEIRSAVVAMTTVGSIQSTSTNAVTVGVDQTAAARG